MERRRAIQVRRSGEQVTTRSASHQREWVQRRGIATRKPMWCTGARRPDQRSRMRLQTPEPPRRWISSFRAGARRPIHQSGRFASNCRPPGPMSADWNRAHATRTTPRLAPKGRPLGHPVRARSTNALLGCGARVGLTRLSASGTRRPIDMSARWSAVRESGLNMLSASLSAYDPKPTSLGS